jgi:glycine cleavage system regulatory protein
MSPEGRKVHLELSEHDALQLIALIRQELYRTDKAWRPYWLRVAQNIQQGMEHAAFKAFHQRDISLKDLSGES